MSKVTYILLSGFIALNFFAADMANARCYPGYWHHGYWHPPTCNGMQCRWVKGYHDQYGYWHYPHKVCNLMR